MARKTLLTEGEIRQFMKLANLGPLGNEKIQEMYGSPKMAGNRDEDESEREDAMGAELSDMDAEADREGDEIADLEGDLDAADDEIAGDDIDMSGLGDDEKEDMMADVVRAVAKALGIEDQVSVEAGSEGGEDLDEPAGGMDDLDIDAVAAEPAVDMAGDLGGEEEREEVPGMRGTYEEEIDNELEEKEDHDEEKEHTNEDEIVSEVARRVAARLQQDNEREAMVDALAERIMKRLTK